MSTAIVAALVAGLAKGAGETASKAVADAYAGLKAAIRKRFGEDSAVAKAVDDLESRPASAGRQSVLREEVEASGAASDPDVVKAAQLLLDRIGEIPGAQTHVQQAIGSYIAQADRAGHAEVHVNTRHERSGDTRGT